jgi:hypothetical protein
MHSDNSDRGAILVHVAFGLLALFLFSGFVIDYGTFWVARGQAQNAADAGALAGVIARLYNDPTNPPASTTTGVVPESVFAATNRNPVWGIVPPSNTVNISYTCPDGVTTTCVAVDIYRDGTNNSSTLPTFFLKLAGVNSQGTKAHAVAKAAPANGTGCLRPWFLPSPPGLTTPDSYGLQVQLHENQTPDGTSTPGAYQQLDVGAGGADIRSAIESCLSGAAANGGFAIDDVADTKPGGTQGPEAQGVQQLFDWDPGATVSGTGLNTKVSGGCGATNSCTCPGNTGSVCPNGSQVSPRVAVVAMCDGTVDANCNFNGKSNKPITITNFLAFFITGCNGVANVCKQGGGDLEIDATLMSTAGLSYATGGPATAGAAFLTVITLIR